MSGEQARLIASDLPRRPPTGCAFSEWLFRQQNRPDQIGNLARVVARDPGWRGADSKAEAVGYLTVMGVNAKNVAVMADAWDRWEEIRASKRATDQRRQKRRAQKAARRAQRR